MTNPLVLEALRATSSVMVSGRTAANVLGVDPRTIRRMIARGELSGRNAARKTFVRVDSLLRFIEGSEK